MCRVNGVCLSPPTTRHAASLHIIRKNTLFFVFLGFSFVFLKPAKRILCCLHFSFFTFHFSLRASRGLSANSLGDMTKWRWKRVEKCERFEKPTA